VPPGSGPRGPQRNAPSCTAPAPRPLSAAPQALVGRPRTLEHPQVAIKGRLPSLSASALPVCPSPRPLPPSLLHKSAGTLRQLLRQQKLHTMLPL